MSIYLKILILLVPFSRWEARPLPFLCDTAVNDYNIVDFGATGDGITLNHPHIQAAVDTCAARGGGRVIIPEGRFLSGSFRLRTGVELHLKKGAVLLGSTRWEHYDRNNWYALVLAKEQRNIAVTGDGSIDGQGAELAKDVDRLYLEGKLKGPYWDNRPHEQHRPQLIDFEQCTNVLIEGITLRNSSCWVQRYGRCDSLNIRNITVQSRAYWNNDGIDLVDCTHTRVTHCDIDAADDGICLKSDRKDLSCADVYIADCRIRSSASALKFGTNSYGGFRRVTVERLDVRDTYRSAVALEIVDGGVMEDISVSKIRAVNTGNAVFLRLGHRNQRVPPGQMRRVRIEDIDVQVPATKPDAGLPFEGPPVKEAHNLIPSVIAGIPGHLIEDVLLRNIQIRFAGGADTARAHVPLTALDSIPERPKAYPEFSMFGELPAWGFYIRHVKGIRFENVTMRCLQRDYRPCVVLDDVEGFSSRRFRAKGRGKGKVISSH